jgi:NDP-sugar pyrophosphorylase family protein
MVEMIQAARAAIQNNQVKVLIEAGGTGWKLWNSTKHYQVLPEPARRFAKPVAQLGNRKLMDFPIESAKRAGIKRIYINIFWDAQSIESYPGIGIHRDQGYNIEFIREPRLFGTGGSIKNFAEFSGLKDDEIVVVMAGDAVHNVNLERVIAEHMETARQEGKPGVTIVSYSVPWDSIGYYGAIKVNGLLPRSSFSSNEEFEAYVQDFLKKQKDREFRSFKIQDYQIKVPRNKAASSFADTFIYVMNGKMINDMLPMFNIPATLPIVDPIEAENKKYFYDINKHMFGVVRSNPEKYFFYAYLMPEEQDGSKKYWIDIGSRAKYYDANMAALDGKFDLGLAGAQGTFWTQREWGWEGKGVMIDPSAKIEGPCIISDGVVVSAKATVKRSTLGAYTFVGESAYLENVVIQPGVNAKEVNSIGQNSHLSNVVVMGDEVAPNSHIVGKGGEFVYSPRNRVVVVPLETDADIPADEKIRKVVSGVNEKDFAHICLGNMPSKHFECAKIDRLIKQVEHAYALYGSVKTEAMNLPFNNNKYIAVLFNNVVSDAAELMVAGWETNDPLAMAVAMLGAGIEIEGHRIKIKTKTSWGMTKDGVSIHVFEIVDENGKRLSDEAVLAIQKKFNEGTVG